MRPLSLGRLAGIALGLAFIIFALPSTALATPPASDNFADATVISSLPFSDSVDITEATTEPSEPQPCDFSPQTVWYSITPSGDGVLRADPAGSSVFDTEINVYQAAGSGFGGLSFLSCASFGDSVTFQVQAGNTYYVQAGNIFGGGGNLMLNLQEIPPPPNDNFANATPIAALPFSDTLDTSAASTEPGEPAPSCAGGSLTSSAWYSFAPAESGSVSASAGGGFPTVVAAYTGSSLASLTEVGCGAFGDRATFRAETGTTYHFQVGGIFGGSGAVQFSLDVAPAPVANFFFSPSDPSIFEDVQFFDQSFDPGDAGIESRAWDLGDGTSATGCCPTHRYAADGDYTVKLTVTTPDGRTASTSQVVQVRTHDVAIKKFTVPTAASAGQTRQITVSLTSKRYPETVQVQLFKGVPGGGLQEIGSLTQSVPVRRAGRTTPFSFSYTFTSDDAAVGKVTFKAVATLVGTRDALPADNEAIAAPTKVSG